jgi:hypothetical protein
MPPPNSSVLQEFDRLSRSSHDFPNQLSDLLYADEYAECVPGLHEDDLKWLVEYLDQVCHHIALLHSPPIVSRYRFSELSIPPVAFSGSPCVSLEKYAALGNLPQHRTRLTLIA